MSRKLLIFLLAMLLLVPSAWAADVGIFQTKTAQTCAQRVASPVAGQSWCFDADTNALKLWNGTAWISVVGGQALPAYTLATLPAAGTAGRLARVTDDVRGIWTDTGTQWIKNFPYVNVEDFGAVGDGTIANAAANTTAFSNAKSAAVAAGMPMFIPIGTWWGSISVSGTDDKLTIIGADWERTILEAKDNSTATIAIAVAGHDVTIENLSIKNTGATNNGTHYGIHSQGDGAGNGASGLTLRRVKVSGYNINIRLDEPNATRLEEVYATGAVHGGFAAPRGANIYAGHPTNHSTGLWMRLVRTSGGKYGYYLDTIEGAVLDALESLLDTENGFIATTSGTAITGLSVSNSQFDSSGAVAMKLYKVNNGHFSNIWVTSTVSDGLSMEESDHNNFSGVQAVGSVGVGIHLLTGSQKNSFTGCQSITNTGDGVKLDSGASGNTFSACAAWNNTGTGFNFLDTTAAEPNQLNGVYALGNTVANHVVQSKDIVIGGSMAGGKTATYTFFRTNIPDGAGSANLSAVPNTDLTVFVAPQAGSLVAIALALNDTRAAGTLNVRPQVNGVSKDNLLVTIDGTNTQFNKLAVVPGSIPVAVGDRVGAFFDTDAGWDTTGGANTADMNVTIVLQTQ